MSADKTPRKRTAFGAGTYARRHTQRHQAATGAFVCSLAIATLSLHYFGFGVALALTAVSVAMCLVIRLRPVPSVAVIGCVLFATLLWAPNGTPSPPLAFDSGFSFDGAFDTMDQTSEVYVLEGPLLGNDRVRLKMYERNTEPRPEIQPRWSTIPPFTEAPETYQL